MPASDAFRGIAYAATVYINSDCREIFSHDILYNLSGFERAKGSSWMVKLRFQTLGGIMDRYGGAGPGFDFLRIALAFSILYAHSFLVTGSRSGLLNEIPGAPEMHRRPVTLLLIPMFFAVSGFLVTGSAFRTRVISKFMTYRVLRIIPALLTEVALSALFLGPVFTAVTLSNYFTDIRFFAYFGNVIGRVRFELPGVFLENPIPGVVNVNLWTLQPEFYCYLAIAALISTSLLFDRRLFTIVFGVITLGLFGVNLVIGFGEPLGNYPPTVVLYYFFCGSLLYHWRYVVPSSVFLFLVAGLVGVVGMRFEGTVFLTPLLFAYAIVYLGTVNIPRLPILQSGDYSYGVYLYGFPIQQALIATFPRLSGHGWWMLGASSLFAMSFAMVSWHFIEKPALGLKRFVTWRQRAAPPDEGARKLPDQLTALWAESLTTGNGHSSEHKK
jgi:peptidoglycan/LPS O-acetylase OafA/YrhL